MKTNDKKELKLKSVEELKKLLQDAAKALSDLHMDNVQNKLKNTRRIFTTRKEIAVMKTFLNMKTKEVKNA